MPNIARAQATRQRILEFLRNQDDNIANTTEIFTALVLPRKHVSYILSRLEQEGKVSPLSPPSSGYWRG
jgi:DNA-binding IclR family transcriptional regulator